MKILRVGIVGDDMLDVQLDNGNILLLELVPLLRRQGFEKLAEDDRILYPRTNGAEVYWTNGPRLTLQEMLEMLQREQDKKTEEEMR